MRPTGAESMAIRRVVSTVVTVTGPFDRKPPRMSPPTWTTPVYRSRRWSFKDGHEGSRSGAETLESLDVAESPQEALCSDQCVGPSCRVGPRLAIIGNAGGCEEVAEPFVDVQLARVASGSHAIAETLYTSQWRH